MHQRQSVGLAAALFMVILSSCATVTVPPAERSRLYPPLTEQLQNALANAKSCDAVDTARSRIVGTDFAYGCFCGQSHPEYKHKSGVNYQDLPISDRLDLVARFYGDKPIDDIDAACRDHDVCWVYTGQEDSDCNTEFYNRLTQLSNEFRERAPSAGYSTAAARCAEFTGTINKVFLTHLIPADYDSALEAVGMNMVKTVMLPVAVLNYFNQKMQQTFLGKEIFLHENDSCSLGDDDQAIMPPVDFSQPLITPKVAPRRIAVTR